MAKLQTKSQPAFKRNDDILSKMWGCVRDSNGIEVLLFLLMVKKSLVDADCIRALACKALCGLSRSDGIRQVIGKLEIFNSGQFQSKFLYKKIKLSSCYEEDDDLDSSCRFLLLMTWVNSAKIRALLLTELNQ